MGFTMVPLDDAIKKMEAILPVTGSNSASVHVKMVGNITDNANPPRNAHIHTPPSNCPADVQYRPTNERISSVVYNMMILTGSHIFTRKIPTNRPPPNDAQYTDVVKEPMAFVHFICFTQNVVKNPAKVSSMALYVPRRKLMFSNIKAFVESGRIRSSLSSSFLLFAICNFCLLKRIIRKGTQAEIPMADVIEQAIHSCDGSSGKGTGSDVVVNGLVVFMKGDVVLFSTDSVVLSNKDTFVQIAWNGKPEVGVETFNNDVTLKVSVSRVVLMFSFKFPKVELNVSNIYDSLPGRLRGFLESFNLVRLRISGSSTKNGAVAKGARIPPKANEKWRACMNDLPSSPHRYTVSALHTEK